LKWKLKDESVVETRIIKDIKEMSQISVSSASYTQVLGDLRSQIYLLEEQIESNPEDLHTVHAHHKLMMQLAPFGGALYLRDESAVNGEALHSALNVAISQALQSAVSKASDLNLNDDNPIITDFKTFDNIEVNGVMNAPDVAKKLYDIEDAVYENEEN
jgi:hypothetical protein